MKKYKSVGFLEYRQIALCFKKIFTTILTTDYNSLPNNLGKTVIYFF